MDEMKLPHYIADRWERRWTGRFAQKLKDLQGGLRIPRVSGDPIRSLEVRCLPERLYGEQSRAHSGLARPDLPAIIPLSAIFARSGRTGTLSVSVSSSKSRMGACYG